MKIDPNQAVNLRQEMVLCADQGIRLHDGAVTPIAELVNSNSAFQVFCRGLDPNTCFILALIPDDKDHPVYFKARDVARGIGVHMQAPVETPEAKKRLWETYVLSKRLAGGATP